ncbi:MAG TPA: hypothetical protein VHA13_03625, partial [Gammaproteobacteria bacterium]|nr:hypothetical protein [Gammaproteobacteria bacterium]
FFQDYLFVVTPFLIRNYYSGVGDQWYTLLDNHTTIASSFPVLLYLLLYKKNTYQQFSTVLVISLLGFVAIYFAQHNNFYYHLLPFFSASIVLSAMFFTILARQSSYTVVDYVSIILFEIFLTLFLLSYLPVIWVTIVLLPNQFFIFFAAVFSFLLLCYRQSLLKISTNLFLVLGISYICFYIVHRIAWSTHQFIITTVLLLLIFSLLAPRKCNNVFGHIVVATLGIMLLAHPIFTAYSVYGKSLEFKDKALNPLISFINKHDGQHSSFYFLSNKVSYSASLINYTQSKITQRFDCLWPVVSFIKNKGKHSADENAFINMIADDLYLQKPDLVFVDLFDKKLFDIDPKFDFIAYLSQNDKFRQEWKAYHRLTDLGTAFNYKVRVFERKKP